MKIIGGWLKNRQLKTPKGDNTRPTSGKVKGSLFNILQGRVEGASVLDLFAGSGSIGIEALSRGATSATFVEKNREAAQCLRENLHCFKIEAPVFQTDAMIALKRLMKKGETFTLIYVDPPYQFDISPLIPLLPGILAEDGILIMERGARTPPSVPPLHLVDSRHFGDTHLFFFSHS